MGDAARLIAAVVSLVISLGLLLVTFDLVRKASKTGGAFEISWQPFAFFIKFWAKAPKEPVVEAAGTEEKPAGALTSEKAPTSAGEVDPPMPRRPEGSGASGGDGV
ncbi:hypothetical protein ACGFJ7_23260 [Actinoplanes sp. NPDC048988]|uniref:hypothetical protein n=1 Tax=Actinoplanes sp. NPDC048988 TaxID=3363901 RepID=UPI003721F40D